MIEHLKRTMELLASRVGSGYGVFFGSLVIGLALGGVSLVYLEARSSVEREPLRASLSGSPGDHTRAEPPELTERLREDSAPRIEKAGEGDMDPGPDQTRHRPGEEPPGRLEAELKEISSRYPGEYGVVLWQPGSGARVAVGAEESFKAASLAKLPILLTLYREASEGRIDLDERVRMGSDDIQPGTGALQDLPPGTYLTLRECAEYLMRESDNTAWKLLEDRLGERRVRSELAAAGARSTRYEYAEHSTTPADTLNLLQRVSDPGYTSPRHSREMLAYMTDTAFEDWLPQGVPPEARVAHKIGILGPNFGDAGLVFPPEEASEKRYYVVALAKETTEPAASAAMREISLAAYRELVDPEARPRSAESKRSRNVVET